MKYYYANAANQPTGPVDLAELARLAATGAINDNTSVIAEGTTTWVPYRQIKQPAAPGVSPAAMTPVNFAPVLSMGSDFSWGDCLYGAWLVFRTGVLMPLTLLRTAIGELALWGRSRSVPSTGSELPVLTHLIVAFRPFVHLLWTFFFLLASLLSLFGKGPFYLGAHGYFDSSYSFPSALGGFLVGLVVSYFVNWLIGYLFESLGLLVRIANDINKLTKR